MLATDTLSLHQPLWCSCRNRCLQHKIRPKHALEVYAAKPKRSLLSSQNTQFSSGQFQIAGVIPSLQIYTHLSTAVRESKSKCNMKAEAFLLRHQSLEPHPGFHRSEQFTNMKESPRPPNPEEEISHL